MNKKFINEIVGWYGTVAIVGAYALSSFNVVSPQTVLYQALNLTGAVGIVCISMQKKAYQPGVLNAIWAVVALVAMVRILS